MNLVYQVESDILQYSRLSKLSYRKDASYFVGRAGLIRIMNLSLAVFSILFMLTGYGPSKLDPENESEQELIRMMKSESFSGYGISLLTLISIILGGCTGVISLIFILLLYFFMEVRCDLLWEKVNQKAHVLACIISVAAAFSDVLSIQEVQAHNCKTKRCEDDLHNTKTTKYEEAFYPPYFICHYTSFVTNYSILVSYLIVWGNYPLDN